MCSSDLYLPKFNPILCYCGYLQPAPDPGAVAPGPGPLSINMMPPIAGCEPKPIEKKSSDLYMCAIHPTRSKSVKKRKCDRSNKINFHIIVYSYFQGSLISLS